MANYPTSVSTDANLYIAKNNLSTTLNGAITNSQTTITAASTTNFPTAGFITIDLEAISYTGISGNDFTGCTRGADGTTAASHTNSTAVYHNVVAAHHNVLKDETKAVQQDLSDSFGAISPTVANATDTSLLGRIKSLAFQVKSITGTTNWYDSVAVSLVNKLSLAGGTMSGAIAMGSNKITGLANGTASSDAATFGQLKILQVKYNTQTSGTTTTSSTFQATNLSLSITPASVNNKILVLVFGSIGITGNNNEAEATIQNTTQSYNLFSTHGQGYVYINSSATLTSLEVACGMGSLDSPASTSSQTYQVRVRSVGGVGTASWSSSNSIMEGIILIEVGA